MLKSLKNISFKKSKTKPSEGKAYQNCAELPVLVFIAIITTGDLTKLITQPPVTDLEDIWERIYNEYTEISGSQSDTRALELYIDINYLANRLTIAYSLINRLYLGRNDEIISELENMGFNFPTADLDSFLERCVTSCKGDEMRLNRAKSEYSDQQSECESVAQDWEDMLSELGKFQGYSIRNGSVAEFCAVEKRYKRHVENMKRNVHHNLEY